MQIEALSKTLAFFDMNNIFKIIPSEIVEKLEQQLQDIFTHQEALEKVTTVLIDDPTDTTLLAVKSNAATVAQ